GFSAERVARLAPDDWRRRAAEFREPNLGRNLALRDALRPVARRHGTTVAAVAVAWTLAWPGVSGAIVGARTPAQVDGWIGAARLALDAADLDEIAAAIARTAPRAAEPEAAPRPLAGRRGPRRGLRPGWAAGCDAPRATARRDRRARARRGSRSRPR